MSPAEKAKNCLVAIAYGRKIVPENDISESRSVQRLMVAALIGQEQKEVRAIVPIPNAGVYLAECWSDLAESQPLWAAFGSHPVANSLFRIRSSALRRLKAASKVARVHLERFQTSVAVIDEAVLTGDSMKLAAIALRGRGVADIHGRTILPPIRRNCRYGVLKVPSQQSFIASQTRGQCDTAKLLGLDSFSSLSVTTARSCASRRSLCSECMDD